MGIGTGLYMYDVIVKKFTFAISSPDEFLLDLLKERSGLGIVWDDVQKWGQGLKDFRCWRKVDIVQEIVPNSRSRDWEGLATDSRQFDINAQLQTR